MDHSCHDYTNKSEEPTGATRTKETQLDSSKFENPNRKMTVEDAEGAPKTYRSARNMNSLENYTISNDHCYARPWNWKSDYNFLRPTKTIFMTKTKSKLKFPHLIYEKREDETSDDLLIDVENIDNNPAPIYDVSKAQILMDECDKHVKLLKKDDEGNPLWDENMVKHNWTLTQSRLFNGVVAILTNHSLSKLASVDANHEAIRRRTTIDKSVQRLRRLLATVFWEPKLTQWLHQLLLDNLDAYHLSIYLEILQTLKAKLPTFVEKMLINTQNSFKLGIATENLLPILKRPWDPILTGPALVQEKHKLPGNPVIIVIPSSPITSTRDLKWINLLSSLGTVVNVPFNLGSSGQRLTMMHCADQMFASIRGQIQEIRNEHPNRNTVLLGLNAGAAMALQIAQTEPCLAVVCLGFSLLTAEGRRGEPEDSLMELQCPVLFVIGQRSSTSSQEDMEDLRERMRVETGLVVVGSADNFLRISRKKKRSEGITQSVVDRCIVDEIGEFISSIILSPYPPQIRQSPTMLTQELTKKQRKRYNSNTSSLDSEDFSALQPIRISRPVGRPPGSKSAKSKLEQKWAAQVAQGTHHHHHPSSSNSSSPPDTPLILDSSSNESGQLQLQSQAPSEQNSNSRISNYHPSNNILLSKLKATLMAPSPHSKTHPHSHSVSANEAPSSMPSSIKKVKTLKPVRTAIPTPSSATTAPKAKLQAYGMSKHNLVSTSKLSSLLQGGIKTIPATQPKSPMVKVLENITITPGNKMFHSPPNKSFNSLNKDAAKQNESQSNVIILPDGKLKTITGNAPNIFRSDSSRYITSKKQLLGNRPPKPVKRIGKTSITATLPPPTNLTTQDIMDLPIIFADDNQIIETPATPAPPSQSTSTSSSKFVLVNKPINFTSTNYVISSSVKKTPTPSAGSGVVYRQTPKYTKIILSKRTPPESSGSNNAASSGSSPNILSKISSLSSEISVKKVTGNMGNFSSAHSSSNSSVMQLENIDLENELVATTIPKPMPLYSGIGGASVGVVERIKRSFSSPPPGGSGVQGISGNINVNNDDDDSDPDYVPPKMIKLN